MADEPNILDTPATTDAQLLIDTADIKTNTDNLDVALSTRGSEATLSTRASEATLASVDASATNIDTSTATTAGATTASATAIGAQADAAATTDTGTFSLMALFKRSLEKLTTLIAGRHANVSLIASAAFTTTQDTADQVNNSARGAHIIIDVTAGTGFSVTPSIQALDAITGKYYDLLVGKAIATTGTNVIKIYPGIPATKEVAAADVLPRNWRVHLEHGNANSVTYSVSAHLLH